tara:strand:+ start:377 stop:706 length:330 start_codon:yes stop_codon:yes gene_type:complete
MGKQGGRVMSPIIEDDGFITVHPPIEGTYYYGGKLYDTNIGSRDMRHGGPFDRGMADSYYRSGRDPHFYVGNTGTSDRVDEAQMSEEEIDAYHAGFSYNQNVEQDFKEW